MSLYSLFKDYITFKLYTLHTVHGKSVVDISVRSLGMVFADVTRPTLLSKVMSVVICRFSSIIITGLFMAKALYAENVGDFARVTESVMIGIQVSQIVSGFLFANVTLIHLQTTNDQILGIALMQAKLTELYYKRQKFWSRKDIDPEDTCGDTKQQKLTLIFGNTFYLLMMIAYVWFMFSIILFGELDAWVPKSHPKIAFAITMYTMTWGIFSATGSALFNLLIVSFCVETRVQFQLINYRLSKIQNTWQEDKANTIKEIKKIVQHHSFLLM